jgi:hypothetical protein
MAECEDSIKYRLRSARASRSATPEPPVDDDRNASAFFDGLVKGSSDSSREDVRQRDDDAGATEAGHLSSVSAVSDVTVLRAREPESELETEDEAVGVAGRPGLPWRRESRTTSHANRFILRLQLRFRLPCPQN